MHMFVYIFRPSYMLLVDLIHQLNMKINITILANEDKYVYSTSDQYLFVVSITP